MKTCPKCNAQIADDAVFCTVCGAPLSANQQFTNQQQAQGNTYVPPVDIYDHTAEFDPKDISDNKVFAMLVYLTGIIGIIIALLASRDSKYAGFHVRQALKFTVVNTLMALIGLLLCWTLIVPLAWIVMSCIFAVIEIICFFQVCAGKAKEPYIIRDLPFLK